MKLKIRKLLKYWILTSLLLGGSSFIYGWVFLSAGCRECPAIYCIMGLIVFMYSLAVNLVYFFLLIPVRKPSIQIFTAIIVCLLPTFIWKFLLLNNQLPDPTEGFMMPVLIVALLSGCYIFIRTCREKKITTS